MECKSLHRDQYRSLARERWACHFRSICHRLLLLNPRFGQSLYVDVKSQDYRTVIGNVDTDRRLGTCFVIVLKRYEAGISQLWDYIANGSFETVKKPLWA